MGETSFNTRTPLEHSFLAGTELTGASGGVYLMRAAESSYFVK